MVQEVLGCADFFLISPKRVGENEDEDRHSHRTHSGLGIREAEV